MTTNIIETTERTNITKITHIIETTEIPGIKMSTKTSIIRNSLTNRIGTTIKQIKNSITNSKTTTIDIKSTNKRNQKKKTTTKSNTSLRLPKLLNPTPLTRLQNKHKYSNSAKLSQLKTTLSKPSHQLTSIRSQSKNNKSPIKNKTNQRSRKNLFKNSIVSKSTINKTRGSSTIKLPGEGSNTSPVITFKSIRKKNRIKIAIRRKNASQRNTNPKFKSPKLQNRNPNLSLSKKLKR